jgi:hypothetical protein
MKTESQSPMIVRGVATPSDASNNITVVIAIAAMSPARNPSAKALVLVII